MTITTEDAEALARQLDANDPGVSDPVAIEFFGDVATALRTLAEERDLGDKQIHGLAEERERWKDRAEAAECRLSDAHRAQGEAEGKLAASEMAGVVEGWKERAERAERDLKDQECANEMLRMFVDGQRVSRIEVEARAERAEAEAERLQEALHQARYHHGSGSPIPRDLLTRGD